MVLHAQPTDPWTRGDFKLLEAYEILQRETCANCGNPTWLCRHDDDDLQWEIRTSVCRSELAVTKWMNLNRKKGKKDGENVYAVPYMLRYEEGKMEPIQDFDKLSTREDFYKAKAEAVNNGG